MGARPTRLCRAAGSRCFRTRATSRTSTIRCASCGCSWTSSLRVIRRGSTPTASEGCCAAVAEPADDTSEDARALALAETLGAQLGRLKGAGPKLRQFLSLLRLDFGADGELPSPGDLPAGARA